LAEPFLQPETFPESESFFSQQLHSTESYHQPDPIVHSVETFHQPSTNFFGEPSPQKSPIQRGRAGPQPSFRSDPLESFPSFSGPSFDTFLLEDAGERPAREIEQPAFSSFNPPPSSPVEKRSRQGAGRLLALPEARSVDEVSFGAKTGQLGSFRTFGGRWFAESPLSSAAWFHGA